jgi:O-antigen ligase
VNAAIDFGRSRTPVREVVAGRQLTATGVLALGAVMTGVLAVYHPMPVLLALAVVAGLTFAFVAPVANLLLVLFLTAIVGWSLQNRLGAPALPSDGLLAAGLLRTAVVVLGLRLAPRQILVAALAIAFLVVTLVQVVHGLSGGHNVRQVGAEGRELLGFATVLIAIPIVADPAGRRRLAQGLTVLGLTLGVWGLMQWAGGIHLGENVDVGLRGAQPFATSGAGQLHGGLYGYPVAVVMASAVLFSVRRLSGVERGVLIAIVATNLLCLLLTYERTFWLTTLASLAFVIARLERGRRLRAATAMLLVGIALVGVLATTSPTDLLAVRDRVLSLGQTANDNSVRYRVVEAQHVLAKVRAHPIAGWGVGDTIYWGRPW